MSNDIRVTSWAQVQDELFYASWDPAIRRFRSPYVFRGLSDAGYALESSLIRLRGPYAQMERHLLRNFRKYAQGLFGDFTSFWHLLAVAQHHGLPTRLLDWTYSPAAALHFATANIERFDLDGVVWMVNLHQVHALLPQALGEPLRAEGADVFTVELLSQLTKAADAAGHGQADEGSSFQHLIRSLEDFDALAAGGEFLLFLEPPSIDERIVNQFALFSVMPNPSRRIDDWLDRRPELCRRLIIPAELKWEVRDKLDQSNVTERVLFPGLDGLCHWLRRHYSQKP